MKCSFCERDAVAKCASRACKAVICDLHGTHDGHTSIHGPRICKVYHHILCDRCSGINTSKEAFGVSDPAPQVTRPLPLQMDRRKLIGVLPENDPPKSHQTTPEANAAGAVESPVSGAGQ